MHRAILSLITIGSFTLLAACSGSSDSGSGNTTAADSTETANSAAVVCVAEGDQGNEKSIGKYCQSSNECPGTTFCTAGLAPKGAEYCTAFCSTDADCGDGAVCYSDPRGKGCAPAKCVQ